MSAAPSPTGPLSGVTVLDLSTFGPGPRCTRLLADYGAQVVKVGPVPSPGVAPNEPSYFAYSGQRGLQRVLIDLKDDDGRGAFLALAAVADVVIESFRPGVMDRLGLGYQTLKEHNPRLVYCSTTGFGQDGPRASWAGHDVNYLAVGGFLAMSTPGVGGAPPLPGATIADAAAGGMHAALAITAALAGRATTGEGTYLDVAVAEGVLWLMSLPIDEQLALGTAPVPGHDLLSGRYACYATYQTRDDKWVAVGAVEAKFFANLCRALGCPEWIERQLDDAAQPAIRAALDTAFATADRDEWVARLGGADTCVAPVLAVDEIWSDPQFTHRGAVTTAVHPTHGSLRQLAPLLAGMARPDDPVALPDPTITDTEHLLKEAGIDPETIATWVARRVVA
ncbi:MAG TPA: CaiB/BaiF CoA-transferase family protein [Acidimicrobiales bacterium]